MMPISRLAEIRERAVKARINSDPRAHVQSTEDLLFVLAAYRASEKLRRCTDMSHVEKLAALNRGKPAKKRIELTGMRFGRWKVLGPGERRGAQLYWSVVCDCGATGQVRSVELRRGRSASCGCLSRDRMRKKSFKHGESAEGTTPEYEAWRSMLRRCKADPAYTRRGISVCARWRDYECFLADMGRRPDGRSLDRINNNGNYEPGNCRWATEFTQANNTTRNRHIAYKGLTKTIAEWSRCLGIHKGTIQARLRRGWSVERALALAGAE